MSRAMALAALRAEARLRKVLADEDSGWTRTVHADGDDIITWQYKDGQQVRINVNPQPLDDGGLSFDVVTHTPEGVTEPWAIQAPLAKAERRARSARRHVDKAVLVADDVVRARRELQDLVREGHFELDLGPAWRVEAHDDGDTLLTWRHTRGVAVRIEMQHELTPAGGVACSVEVLEPGGATFAVITDGHGILDAMEWARSLCREASRIEQAIVTVPATGASVAVGPGGVEVSITYPCAQAVADAAREHLAALVEHRHAPAILALASALPGHLMEQIHAACQLRRNAEPWGDDPDRVWQYRPQGSLEHHGWWSGFWDGPHATEDEARRAARLQQSDGGPKA